MTSNLANVLAARAWSVAPDEPPAPFQLPEHFFQAVAAKLGRRIGIKRCRRLKPHTGDFA